MDLLLYMNSGGKVTVILLLLILFWTTLDITKSEQIADQLPAAGNTTYKLQRLSGAADKTTIEHYVSLRQTHCPAATGHLCGGSLISRNVVITAAHCFLDRDSYDGTFLDKSEFVIVLGNLHGATQKDYPLSFDLERLFLQQAKFNVNNYDKNIALILIRGMVPSFIEPVELAEVMFKPLTMCQITGWNSDEIDYFKGQLITFDVSLVEKRDCVANRDTLVPGILCASNANKLPLPACTVDGGAPLMCDGQLVAISSWNIRCGLPQWNSVYTSVPYYRAWIDDIVSRYHPGVERMEHPPEEIYDRDFEQIDVAAKSKAMLTGFYRILSFTFLWHF